MEPHLSVRIAYGAMDFCNPWTPALLDRALAAADIPPGARTLDLGCANAAVALHLAERHGFLVEAIERSVTMSQIARERIVGRGAPGKVTLHNLDSRDYLKDAEPFDLIACAGAAWVAESHAPEAILAELARHARPGGFILWADPFWKAEPAPELKAMVGRFAEHRSHAENVAAGEAAGLSCRYAATASDADCDDYTWRIIAAGRAWLDVNPGHAEAEGLAAHLSFLQAVYLSMGRAAIGFGVYLFRKP